MLSNCRKSRAQVNLLVKTIGAAVVASTITPAFAQDEPRRAGASVLLEEVIVTARKKEEGLQDVPLSVSALGSDQIEALKIRNLGNLTVGLPNVAFDDVGTIKGTANFSIRGLGVNSSVPSIDPTVGTFVDGIYLGLNSGVIFDTFDLEAVEVLRGPQGILFGRNVTGGAVLLRSKKPGDEFEAQLRTAVDGGGDGGLNSYLMGSVGGPLSDTLSVKVAAYYNDDEGYFENLSNGEDFGEIEQTMIRPTVVWAPTDELELVFRYTYSDIEGDGAAMQTHTNGFGIPGTPVNFERDSFDLSLNDTGFQKTESDLFSLEANWDVGESGLVTAILGYRDLEQDAVVELDAQPVRVIEGEAQITSEQTSFELRYNNNFNDVVDLTTGIYYFDHELQYHEGRLGFFDFFVPGEPALTLDGGGDYEVETAALFLSADFKVTDALTLTAGARYTEEKKAADIATLTLNVNSPLAPMPRCNVIEATCVFDFSEEDTFYSFSPKLGATLWVNDSTNLYAHWTRGFRSGGYNLRNLSIDPAAPPSFDQEQVDNFEIGFKMDLGRGRLNGAVFHNEIQDMQRELNEPDPLAAVAQVIRNTADASITGIEIDGLYSVTDALVVNFSLGWIDAEYDDIFFDISGVTGVIDEADFALDLPRAPELTYSLGLIYDQDLGDLGTLVSRLSYSYRDESAYTDNNLGFVLEQDVVNAGLDFYSADGHWVVSLYGRNLLNDVLHGADSQLPPQFNGIDLGGTASPLSKGRVIGAEVTYTF